MEPNYKKAYVETSGEFRESGGSKESVEKLYDLLYELESADRTNNDTLALSNLYSLLGFHQSAYEVFKMVADSSDRKVVSKLYVMKEKAKSHKNNFIIKDLRKLRQKKEKTTLLESDFLVSEIDTSKIKIGKSVVIFNKIVESDNLEVFNYGEHEFSTYASQVVDFTFWLGGCKEELIEFYNEGLNQFAEETADDDWYYTLEVFSVRIIVGKNESLYAEISGGDDFIQDHILDIELNNRAVIGMNYDG